MAFDQPPLVEEGSGATLPESVPAQRSVRRRREFVGSGSHRVLEHAIKRMENG